MKILRASRASSRDAQQEAPATTRFRLRLSAPMVVALLALFFALGAPAVWSHGGNSQAVHACVNNATGEVTVIADSTGYGNPNLRCQRPNEQHDLDWNVAGPAGPQGPAGPAGPAGAAGKDGAPAVAPSFEVFRTSGVTPAEPFRRLDAGQNKVVARLTGLPSGTFMLKANLWVSSAPQLSVVCDLTTPPLGGFNHVAAHTPPVSHNIVGSTPAERAKDWLRKRSSQTLALHNVVTLPRPSGRAGNQVVLTCGNNAKAGYARVGDLSLIAVRIGGGPK